MRKLIVILLAIVTIHSCNETRESYAIEIDLEGTEGKWVKLMGMEDRNYVVFDSVLVTAEIPAELSKNPEGVTTMYLTVEGGEDSIQMFIENAEYHISDLQNWNSEGAELYGVHAIPHTVLIDREGIIHSKKLHGNDLREAIESLL